MCLKLEPIRPASPKESPLHVGRARQRKPWHVEQWEGGPFHAEGSMA